MDQTNKKIINKYADNVYATLCKTEELATQLNWYMEYLDLTQGGMLESTAAETRKLYVAANQFKKLVSQLARDLTTQQMILLDVTDAFDRSSKDKEQCD